LNIFTFRFTHIQLRSQRDDTMQSDIIQIRLVR
jgi:hypothetical protein